MRTFEIVFLLIASTVAAHAQTQTQPSNLGPVPQGARIAIVDANGRFAFAQLDASLEIVAANNGGLYTIRAVVPASASISERVLTVKPTDPTQITITLPSAPQGQSLLIARNGMILSSGEDYTVAGTVVSFVAQHRPSPGQVFHIRYRE